MAGKVLTKFRENPQTIEFSKSNPFNQISQISEQKIQWTEIPGTKFSKSLVSLLTLSLGVSHCGRKIERNGNFQ